MKHSKTVIGLAGLGLGTIVGFVSGYVATKIIDNRKINRILREENAVDEKVLDGDITCEFVGSEACNSCNDPDCTLINE